VWCREGVCCRGGGVLKGGEVCRVTEPKLFVSALAPAPTSAW
jgi:hypothetical protein